MNGKKTIALMMALMLLVGCVVGGTVAWLVAAPQTVTNTFCIGQVAITMDETDVNLYGVKDSETRVMANEYKLIPGYSYTKDPTIHVDAGSESCYLFIKVENGIAAIEAANDAGAGIYNIATQIENNGWKVVPGQTGVYYKTWTAGSAVTDVPVFESFKLKDDAAVSTFASAKIIITAYAVQQEGLDVAAAWTAAQAAANP